MITEKMQILDLITQAQIGTHWLSLTEMKYTSTEHFCDVLREFKSSHGNIPIFNVGTLLSYAYISLVLPKQTIFEGLDYSQIDITQFKIIYNTYTKDNDKEESMVRHIRNALSHGNISVKNNKFYFKDQNPKDPEKQIEVEIEFGAFGNFLDNTFHLFKKQYFEKEDSEMK